MKRLCVILTVLLLLLSNLFAIENSAYVYTSRDDIYKRVNSLARQSGVLGVAVSPVTGGELLITLERIDEAKLSAKERSEYDYLKDILTNPKTNFEAKYFGVDGTLKTNIQLNFGPFSLFDYSNTFEFAPQKDRSNEVLEPYRFTDPSISAIVNFYFGPVVSLNADFSINFPKHHVYESSLGWLLSGYGKQFNFIGIGHSPTAIPSDFPYRVSLGAGNNFMSFVMGRLPHSFGASNVSDMVVSDNFTYQEVALLSFFSPYFSYHMSLTRFDRLFYHDGYESFSRNEFTGMQQIRVVHEVEATIFDKLRFTVMLGTLYQSDSLFDLRFFYPFYWQHNYQNFDNTPEKKYFDEANNIMGVNVDYVIVKGWSVGLQFVFDQGQLPGEIEDEMPGAWGLMLQANNATPIKGGVLSSFIETTYTNPYLYLNYKYDNGNIVDNNLDYIVGYHGEWLDDVGYSGFMYGPSTFMVAIGSEYEVYDYKWSVWEDFIYKLQGVPGFTIQAMGRNDTKVETNGINEVSNARKAGVVYEHMFQLRAGGDFKLGRHMIFEGGLYMSFYINYNNVKDAPLMFKPLLSLKFKCEFD